MKVLTRYRLFLWYFSHFKVPLIAKVKPKLLVLDDEKILIKLPLHRINRNHLHSMYFGSLAIGADLAGGLHGFYHAKKQQVQISLAFKSLQAQFIKRPESDVYFLSTMGKEVEEMILQAKETGLRVNKPLVIKAFTNYPEASEEVALFTMELSLKLTPPK